jgi:hypothetical protein
MCKAELVFFWQAPVWKMEWILRISSTATSSYVISLNNGKSLSLLAEQHVTWLKKIEDFSCIEKADDDKTVSHRKAVRGQAVDCSEGRVWLARKSSKDL